MISNYISIQARVSQCLENYSGLDQCLDEIMSILNEGFNWKALTYSTHSLTTSSSIPVKYKEKIFAHFETHQEKVDDHQREFLKSLGIQIGQCIYFENEHIELLDFVENGNLPLHAVGPDGIIIWANKAELSALGYSNEEYVGHSIAKFHADPEVINDILARLSKNEILQNYPARLVRKDGIIRNVLINSSVYWQNGKFMHTRCFTRDVTDLVRAKIQADESSEKISTSERLLKVVTNSLPVLVAYMNTDRRYQFINSAYKTWFGIDQDSLIGTHVKDFVGEKVYNKARIPLDKAFAGEVVEFDQQAEYPTGTRRIHVVYTPDIDPLTGLVRGVVSLVHDVSDDFLVKKRLEKLVSELHLERDIRDKFVAALSHDLRTPLTSAKMSAQLLDRKASDIAQVHKLSSRIVANMERADTMIRDLLDANRIKAGEQISLDFETCHLNALITETVDELTSVHGARLHFTASEQITGIWDATSIRRIIENLVSNALKYGSSELPVDIALSKLDDGICIKVHNHGNPLSEEDQKLIFEQYKRTQSASVGNHKGWGIGLTLVKGLVEAHRGTISVESTPLSGTTFAVKLPMDSRQTEN